MVRLSIDAMGLLEIGVWLVLTLFVVVPGGFFVWLGWLDVRDRRRRDAIEPTRQEP